MPQSVKDGPISVKVGDILAGKFRVERVLGEGGMGVVVAATHIGLNQRVAIKLMLPHALVSAENVERFEREARAAVRLKSDHVAKVSDVGRLESGSPYMVMEFLEGQDLDQVIESQGTLPVEVAVDYVVQASEAVAEAHALGIVHRDLKPKNLFLTTRLNGSALVKVLDFGISKSSGIEDMSLTSTTQVMGSPNYMSPEQLRSARDVDHRTDIWALGAILYELLTGRVPFVAETVTQLTAMVIQDPPRPMSDLRPDMPPELIKVVSKCLEKRREDRYSSIAELVDALAPFASAEGVAKVRDIVRSSGEVMPSKSVAPSERSSVRVMGANTDSAWDRTQLANTAPTKSKWPLFVGAAAVLVLVGASAFFVFKTPAASGPTTPPASAVVDVKAPPSVATLPSDLPTTRDPLHPLLVSPTGGSEHPAPSGLGIVSKPPALTSSKDAGVTKKPDAAVNGTGELLPNVRN